VSDDVHVLFDDFAAQHARGEHPDARDYLARAGAGREELASLLDAFLAAAPVRPPSEETRATFAALVLTEAPLLTERVRRGWRRDEVVDWIRERFGIGEEKREKVAGYWHEVETGLLPVSAVSERLREALRERFGDAADVATAWAPAAAPTLKYLRVQDAPDLAAAAPPAPAARAEEPDEVDRLFGTSPLG
jgi:hypothetical protein